MESEIKCIYNYYDTLLDIWNIWNEGVLYGQFPQGAKNFTQALGIDTADGRSRAKEIYRIGLLKKELTKGESGLGYISEGNNIQSDLGYVSAIISKAAKKNRTHKIDNALSSLCSIYAIIQSIKINNVEVSINTLIQRLDDMFPCPSHINFLKWHRYTLSAFFCEMKYREKELSEQEWENTNSKEFVDFLCGRGNCPSMTIRTIKDKGFEARKTIKSSSDLEDAIRRKISLTDIIHQKTPLFIMGGEEKNPRGFYGMSLKYNESFLRICYDLEKNDIMNSPFINLYDEDSEKSAKGNVLKVLSNIFNQQNYNVKLEFQKLMKTIYDGAIEALDILNYHPKSTSVPQNVETYKNYMAAIRTKPFIIIGGYSGTGKSQKVKELAYLTCPNIDGLQGVKAPGNYALISVKPNWHDSTELLGFDSTMSRKYIVTDFMRFVVKAMLYEDKKIPFFCCIDEMNLAPVEEYFAEFLSVLESRKKIQNGNDTRIVSEPLVSATVFNKKYGDDGWNIFMDLGLQTANERTEAKDGNLKVHEKDQNVEDLFVRRDVVERLKKEGLCIPSNLIVIGTVNMDDTTNSFSRKVIDRAFIIETDIEKFDKDKYFNADDSLQYGNMENADVFVCDEVRSDQALDHFDFNLTEEEKGNIIGYINDLNAAMAGTSFQVGYRVLNEAILYYRAMKIVNGGEASLEQMKNDILMMKVLPRIEGDSAARKALEGLKKYIEKNLPADSVWINIKYDMQAIDIANLPSTPWKYSLLKISYMLNLLNSGDGFTRFWK